MKKTFLLLLPLLLGVTRCQSPEEAGLVELTGFGDNPGNLSAYLYRPSGLAGNETAPLLVVLHGCGSSATEMAEWTGWNELAEEEEFLVLYPQQKTINNLQNCFNWFTAEDASKGSGEAASIRQMISFVLAEEAVDADRIYVTGFSAGGAMTAVMLATAPEVFAGGAVVAGIPYGAAANLAAGLQAMQGTIDLEPAEWEERVRAQNPEFLSLYPKLAVVHGTDDPMVSFHNAGELTEQWIALLNLNAADSTSATAFQDNAGVTLTYWQDDTGEPLILKYEVDNLGHNLPVDPGEGPAQGGQTGTFAKDVDFYSSYWIARFFGLTN